ncbi:MAG: glycoside hydrolase family 31 protein, partial [Longicatena sp.]
MNKKNSMKVLKKVGVISMATAMTVSNVQGVFVNALAKNVSAQTVKQAKDADGYTRLGTIKEISSVNNNVFIIYNTGEKLRLTFLNENMFRMYMVTSESEKFDEYPSPNSKDHKATITAKTDAAFYSENKTKPTITKSGDVSTIATSKLKLEVNEKTSLMKLVKIDGTVVWEEKEPLKYKGANTIQTLVTSEDEYFYGGGTQNGRFSHKGKSIEIKNTNNWVDKGVASPNPFYWSTKGYGVVRNTWKPGVYDFAKTDANTVTTMHSEERFDAYYFVDDGVEKILGDYYELTGKPAELPEYASYLGHLNCYNRDFWLEAKEGVGVKLGDKWYTESQSNNGGAKETLLGDANTTAQQIIEDHKSHDMPIGWFLPNDGYGCGYGQEESQAGDIQNLKNFGDYANKNGVEIGLWTQSNLWPADPANPKKGERDIYKEVGAGVHAVKTDVAWVGAGYSMALNGISVAYDAISSKSQTKPTIVTLDGWAGSQRYGGIWSGDQSGGQWEYIRFHIPTYIGTSLSGQPNVGSDMDGIFGGGNKIVQTRDFQWKAFTTYMLDMDGWGSNQKTPWALGGDTTSINRAYLKLKAQLTPYTSTISHEATAKGGLPMIRAMFLEEENAYTLGTNTEYQYMWGNDFLVAPVYQNTNGGTNGDDIRNGIYLPNTSDVWVDYFTGKQYRGGQIYDNFDAPLWKLPVLVKNGAIIPMNPENNNPKPITKENPDGLDRSKRIVEFYPHGNTSFELYEDDGISLGGAGTTTMLTSAVNNDVVTLKADKTLGNAYAGMVKERDTEFIVNVSKEPSSVTGNVKGAAATFTKVTTQKEFDEATGNVYFYDANPSVFVKQYADADSKYASIADTTTPKLHVKAAEKLDITQYDFEVVINGFENKQDLGKDELNTNIAVPTGLAVASKTDAQITMGWTAAADAVTYDIEVDGAIMRNVIAASYTQTGLTFLSDHTYRVRTVNAEGFSNWSELVSVQTSDNPYRNVPSSIKTTWNYGDKWGNVANAFDHDQGTMFHSSDAVTPEQTMILDLSSGYQLDKLTYQPRMDNKGNGTVYKMDVYGSLDGIHYTKFWDGNANPAWTYDTDNKEVKDIKEMDFGGKKARYLKISVLSSVGGFFSAAEITPYKKDGTSAFLVGDVAPNGVIDDNDLTFFENYIGMIPADSDFEYSTLGNFDNNEIIDAFDVSFVARMLGKTPVNDATAAKGVEGKINLFPSKTDIKRGDLVTIQVYGMGMKNVNAVSVEMPVDQLNFEITNFGRSSTDTIAMRNFSKTRLHTNKALDNYFCFTNQGTQPLINGSKSLGSITIKAIQDFTWDTKATKAVLVGQDLSTVDAIIDYTEQPTVPDAMTTLTAANITDTEAKDPITGDAVDQKVLWQQAGWLAGLFNGKMSNDAEFKWIFGNETDATYPTFIKVPMDLVFNLDKARPIKSFKMHARKTGNGAVLKSKASIIDENGVIYDFPEQSGATPEFIISAATPRNSGGKAAMGKIATVIFTPLETSGVAGDNIQGGQKTNRMLTLQELEIIEDGGVQPQSIAFDESSVSELHIGEIGEVSATIAPTNATNPYADITSSDETIVKVDTIPTATGYIYTVQGLKAGTATLTATSKVGGKTATREITVVDGVSTKVLQEKIAEGKALIDYLYTPETYKAVSDAVAAGEALLNKAGVTQDEINDATMNLITALSSIAYKGSEDSRPDSLNLLSKTGMSGVSATSESDGNVVGFAIDGKEDTIWHSGYQANDKLPQVTVFDLGADTSLEQIDYLPRQGSHNGHITKYQIDVSMDNATFTPVLIGAFKHDGTSLLKPGEYKKIKFAPVQARYVRMTALETLGDTKNKFASTAELNFYGTTKAIVVNKLLLTAAVTKADQLVA